LNEWVKGGALGVEKLDSASEGIQKRRKGSMETERQGSMLGKRTQEQVLTGPTHRKKSLGMAALVRESALIRIYSGVSRNMQIF
jgi:hypothetical protein